MTPTATDHSEDIDDAPPAVDGDDGVDRTDDAEAPIDVDEGPPSGLSWPKVVVLGAALAFLGFAFALFLGRDRPPASDSVDVGFMQDMISHHEQAVEMAQTELVNGSDPTVRAFAREILMFQSKEIGSMERLLADWDSGRGDPERQAMTWMGMPSAVDRMPGMATGEELDRLRAAQGTAADALFLDLMARHHLGGIHMSEYAADNAGTSDARDFAAIVGRNQAIEVNEYGLTAERLGLPVEIERVDVPPAPGA